jgi:predicted ABC-type exoprotein transport system permease subunit
MILLFLVVAIGSAVFFYIRHRNRIEPERRVPAVVYVLAVIVCVGIAGFVGVVRLLILLSPVVAIGSAVFFYTRHCNRIEPERRVPAVVYALAVIVCGGIAGFLGVAFGTSWACSRPNPGNLCGLVGLFVVGPISCLLAIVLVGLALSLIRPEPKSGG